MEKWLENRRADKGIHAYALETAHPYELLLFDNRHPEKNLYINSAIKASLVKGVLKVAIEDIPAANDGDVHYNAKIYFLIEKKPKSIEIYANGTKQDLRIETGNDFITNQ